MRKSGKTTRLVDEAIQHFFKEGSITFLPTHMLRDLKNLRNYSPKKRAELLHFIDPDADLGNFAQEHFINQFRQRLHTEHSGCFLEPIQHTFKIKRDEKS